MGLVPLHCGYIEEVFVYFGLLLLPFFLLAMAQNWYRHLFDSLFCSIMFAAVI
jgi:hypothetical protein